MKQNPPKLGAVFFCHSLRHIIPWDTSKPLLNWGVFSPLFPKSNLTFSFNQSIQVAAGSPVGLPLLHIFQTPYINWKPEPEQCLLLCIVKAEASSCSSSNQHLYKNWGTGTAQKEMEFLYPNLWNPTPNCSPIIVFIIAEGILKFYKSTHWNYCFISTVSPGIKNNFSSVSLKKANNQRSSAAVFSNQP